MRQVWRRMSQVYQNPASVVSSWRGVNVHQNKVADGSAWLAILIKVESKGKTRTCPKIFGEFIVASTDANKKIDNNMRIIRHYEPIMPAELHTRLRQLYATWVDSIYNMEKLDLGEEENEKGRCIDQSINR